MCGRYAIYTEEENLEIREIIRDINDRYINAAEQMKLGEICPSNIAPVVLSDPTDRYRGALLKWGIGNTRFNNGILINARCESVFEKPTFRNLIPVNRCLLPASCFFEWKTNASGKKIKYSMRPAGSTCFYMAGIFDNFDNFVIITTDPSAQAAKIHERMPAIFRSREEALEWISPGANINGTVQSLLVPFDGDLSITAA